jgi:hypothetical protein
VSRDWGDFAHAEIAVRGDASTRWQPMRWD